MIEQELYARLLPLCEAMDKMIDDALCRPRSSCASSQASSARHTTCCAR